jgi:hypothetical protein
LIEETLKHARNTDNDSDSDWMNMLEDIDSEFINEDLDFNPFEDVSLIQNNDIIEKISIDLSKRGRYENAENIVLEMTQISDRHKCWEEIAKNTYKEKGWKKALKVVNQFQNAEVKTHYLKSLADSLNSTESTKELILNARSYYFDDIESMEKLLQQHALHELFYKDASSEKIERFNRTLNIQWALDIKNQFT